MTKTTVPLVVLTRAYQTKGVTLGILQVKGEDHPPIFTLENPWINNKPFISCIPADCYSCRPYSGVKYRDVYIVDGVPDRSGILFHNGNLEKHTQGCILLGMSAGELDGQPAVLQSRDAVNCFRRLMGKEHFILQIKDVR